MRSDFKRFSKTRVVLLLGFAVFLFYTIKFIRLDLAFMSLSQGTTKTNLVLLFGQPDDIDTSQWACQKVRWIEKPVSAIPTSLYVWKVFPKMWIVGLDESGKVISKETRSLP